MHRALVIIALLAGCVGPGSAASGDHIGTGKNDSLLRPVISVHEQEAIAAVRDQERELERIASLPPRERVAREARLGRTFEKLLEATRETKVHNRALHWLAAWRLDYADGEGVEELLDQLDGSAYPSFKQAGALLRVRLRCRQGRIGEARGLADALVRQVPELKIAEALVGFHELVGTAAPRPPAMNLTGGPTDPAGARPEPWLAYLFIDGTDPYGIERLRGLLDELRDTRYDGKVRLVCVAFGGKPLETVGAVNEITAGRDVDVLWPNPSDGAATRWSSEWSLPGLPAVALIGPDRTIMAVEPQLKTLRALVGKQDSGGARRDAPPSGDARGAKPAWQR